MPVVFVKSRVVHESRYRLEQSGRYCNKGSRVPELLLCIGRNAPTQLAEMTSKYSTRRLLSSRTDEDNKPRRFGSPSRLTLVNALVLLFVFYFVQELLLHCKFRYVVCITKGSFTIPFGAQLSDFSCLAIEQRFLHHNETVIFAVFLIDVVSLQFERKHAYVSGNGFRGDMKSFVSHPAYKKLFCCYQKHSSLTQV